MGKGTNGRYGKGRKFELLVQSLKISSSYKTQQQIRKTLKNELWSRVWSVSCRFARQENLELPRKNSDLNLPLNDVTLSPNT